MEEEIIKSKYYLVNKKIVNIIIAIILGIILLYCSIHYLISLSQLNNLDQYIEDVNTTSYTTGQYEFKRNNPFDNVYITSTSVNSATATVRIVDAEDGSVVIDPIQIEPYETVKIDNKEFYGLDGSGYYRLEAIGEVEAEYIFNIEKKILD